MKMVVYCCSLSLISSTLNGQIVKSHVPTGAKTVEQLTEELLRLRKDSLSHPPIFRREAIRLWTQDNKKSIEDSLEYSNFTPSLSVTEAAASWFAVMTDKNQSTSSGISQRQRMLLASEPEKLRELLADRAAVLARENHKLGTSDPAGLFGSGRPDEERSVEAFQRLSGDLVRVATSGSTADGFNVPTKPGAKSNIRAFNPGSNSELTPATTDNQRLETIRRIKMEAFQRNQKHEDDQWNIIASKMWSETVNNFRISPLNSGNDQIKSNNENER